MGLQASGRPSDAASGQSTVAGDPGRCQCGSLAAPLAVANRDGPGRPLQVLGDDQGRQERNPILEFRRYEISLARIDSEVQLELAIRVRVLEFRRVGEISTPASA